MIGHLRPKEMVLKTENTDKMQAATFTSETSVSSSLSHLKADLTPLQCGQLSSTEAGARNRY